MELQPCTMLPPHAVHVGAVCCTKLQGGCVCFQKPHPGVGGGSLGGATRAGGPPGGLTPARFSSHGKHIVITFHLNVRVAQNCLRILQVHFFLSVCRQNSWFVTNRTCQIITPCPFDPTPFRVAAPVVTRRSQRAVTGAAHGQVSLGPAPIGHFGQSHVPPSH